MTLGELDVELAKRGARMNARSAPGQLRHRNLVLLYAVVNGKNVEVSFKAETLEGAVLGALARLDLYIAQSHAA